VASPWVGTETLLGSASTRDIYVRYEPLVGKEKAGGENVRRARSGVPLATPLPYHAHPIVLEADMRTRKLQVVFVICGIMKVAPLHDATFSESFPFFPRYWTLLCLQEVYIVLDDQSFSAFAYR
jgi:hypothetical protein